MVANPSTFRLDFPEFADPAAYPDSGIAYWMNMASLMINPQRWPHRAGNGVSAYGSLAFSAQPAPGDSIDLNGTVVTFVASGATGNEVNVGVSLSQTLAFLLSLLDGSTDVNLTQFYYGVVGSQLNLSGVPAGTLGNALTIAADSTVITPSGATLIGGVSGNSLYDVGTELFVAHNLVLERQAAKAANRGAPPGVSRGAIGSESAGGASVSYDTSSGLLTDAGHWNLTTYGTRFVELVRLVGAGPVQVGWGHSPVGVGPAWPGPNGGYLSGQSW